MDLWKYVRSAVYLAIIRIVIYILAPPFYEDLFNPENNI